MIQFEVGQRLFGQGEYECVVVKRTAKTVTIKFVVSGRMVLKKISNSPRSEYEYVSLLDYDLRAIDTEKRIDQPMSTPHNQHLFFNGVYLDPAVEF